MSVDNSDMYKLDISNLENIFVCCVLLTITNATPNRMKKKTEL